MARAQPVPYAKSSLKNTVLPPRNVNAGMCAREMRERDHERSLSSSPGIFKDNENHFSLEQINMQHTNLVKHERQGNGHQLYSLYPLHQGSIVHVAFVWWNVSLETINNSGSSWLVWADLSINTLTAAHTHQRGDRVVVLTEAGRELVNVSWQAEQIWLMVFFIFIVGLASVEKPKARRALAFCVTR